MRRPVAIALSLAVNILFAAAPAAADNSSDVVEACPAPEVVRDYDTDRFAVAVTLVATGCPQREERQFSLWVSVTRRDNTQAHGSTRGVVCGPFPAASDTETQRRYSCDADVAVDHPPFEAAHYRVEVTYPGAHGEEVSVVESFCISDGAGARCRPHGDSP